MNIVDYSPLDTRLRHGSAQLDLVVKCLPPLSAEWMDTHDAICLPAHYLVGEENATHFWVLVLAFVHYRLVEGETGGRGERNVKYTREEPGVTPSRHNYHGRRKELQ